MTTQISSVIPLIDLYYSSSAGASEAAAINDAGMAVGVFQQASSNIAVFWQGSAVGALAGLPGYGDSGAYALNDQGQIVGFVATDTYISSEHAALWMNGSVTLIDGTQGSSLADAINDQGQVVGVAGPAGGLQRAFVWQDGSLTYLANLPGVSGTFSSIYESYAYAINSSGQIVGSAANAQGVERPVLWKDGQITDLGALTSGQSGVALGINTAGQIVGDSGSSQAFLWQDGTMTALAPLSGYSVALANGINDEGIIVGAAAQSTTSGASRAVIWQNGVATDLNSLLPSSYLGGTLTSAYTINDANQLLASDGNTNYVLTLGAGTAGLTAASATQSFAAGKISGPVPILDSAAGVQADLDALQAMAAAGLIASVALTDGDTPTLTVSPAQFAADSAILEDIQSTYILTVSGPVSAASLTSISGRSLSAVTVSDSAANIVANLQNIEGVAQAGVLTAIDLTDPGTPLLTLTVDQMIGDTKALAAISGSYQVDLINVPVATVTYWAAQPHIAAMSVTDQGISIGNALDTLETLAQAGRLTAINLLSGGTALPLLYVNGEQLADDQAALAKVSGDYTVEIEAPNSVNQVFSGLAGHGNFVQFNGDAAQFTLALNADGSLTVQGFGISDRFSGVQELRFFDYSAFVAQTPGINGQVTTGNVTELYSAVLAREPDVTGLSFYQTYLTANPGTSLLQFAEWFLSSSEYTSNSTHDYAESSTGDAQFITDSYQNLLHRAPSPAEVSFYQTNVIAPIEAGIAAGTQAYAGAQLHAHALMLVYFSASPEFLSDVQVTAQNPVSAQHWLVLT